MKSIIKNPLSHMLQGLAHWMAYRYEMSNIKVIEAVAVSEASDILRANLPKDYVVDTEITKTSLPIVGNKKIDLGNSSKTDGTFKCLIEFKLADATNAGYAGDVSKLKEIKQKDTSIDCLVVILYRKSCAFDSPQKLVDSNGKAKRSTIKVGKNGKPVKVRRACNSFTSIKNNSSKKTICLEVL